MMRILTLPAIGVALLHAAGANAAADAVAAASAANGQDMPRRMTDMPTGTATSNFSLTLGATAWSGDFGAPTTSDISSVALGARYRTGNLRLMALLPWMRIKSDGSIFTAIGGTPLVLGPKVPTQHRVRDGLSDVTLGASYLLPSTAGPDIEFIGRVKLPTASKSSGVSTGKTDYSAGVEISKTIGRFAPSVSVTYRVFGDNATWDLRNGFAASVGSTFAITEKIVALVSYDYARAATSLVPAAHELAAGISAPFAHDRLRLTVYGSKGLSNGAPDVSGGLSIAANF